jgi:hypothetical protein
MEPGMFWADLQAFEKAVSEDIPGAILLVPDMERCPPFWLSVIWDEPEDPPIDDPSCVEVE